MTRKRAPAGAPPEEHIQPAIHRFEVDLELRLQLVAAAYRDPVRAMASTSRAAPPGDAAWPYREWAASGR